jgi:hypothetical protein
MEEVVFREDAHNTWNMLKRGESSVIMARPVFGIHCVAVARAEHDIYVVIPHGVLLIRRQILAKFVLWTLAPQTTMALEIM